MSAHIKAPLVWTGLMPVVFPSVSLLIVTTARSVMEAALDDLNPLILARTPLNPVDQTMFASNAA